MSYIEFCNEIKEEVQELLGMDYDISITRVEKLNGVILQSLVILKKDECIAPNLYLESYYAEYQKGKSVKIIVIDLMEMYFQVDKRIDLSCENLINFDQAKDKIYFKLINYERNKDMLRNTPHKRWMDLEIIFAIVVKQDKEGIGSITIKKELFEKWKIDLEGIYKIAKHNTPLLFGASVKPMEEIIKDIMMKQFTDMDCDDDDDDDDEVKMMMDIMLSNNGSNHDKPDMYVASNVTGINGATLLIYDNELCNLSTRIGSDFYILPSSIHEIILVPSKETMSKKALLEMVKDVNGSHVPVNEILSDNIYFYDHEQDEVHALF